MKNVWTSIDGHPVLQHGNTIIQTTSDEEERIHALLKREQALGDDIRALEVKIILRVRPKATAMEVAFGW